MLTHADDFAVALVRSYAELLGQDLLEFSIDNVDPAEVAQALYSAPRIVLCHDRSADPLFTYANDAAQQLWKMNWNEMIGMPSRCSAVPAARTQRARQLERAAQDGFIRDYCGIRIASDGTRFEIRDVVIWMVTDASGSVIGQAATFINWTVLDSAERHR